MPALALYSINWDGWGIAPAIWAVMMIIVSGAITTQVTIKHHDTTYMLVIVWALIAICIRHLDTPLITVTAAVTAIFLILFNLEIVPKPFSYR